MDGGVEAASYEEDIKNEQQQKKLLAMRKIRIGNDIEVAWEVKTGGEALSLEGRKLRVYVRSAYERQEIEEFSVEGCTVRFMYPAKMQRAVGARAVELVDETKDVRTVCADEAFHLVAHTSEEDAENAAVGNAGAQEFEKYLVSLKSNVVVARPGMSAYEIWKGQGNEGTEEEFLASITGPKGEKGDKGDDGKDGNGIKRIWRLEGGETRSIELQGDEIDLQGLTLDQWLIKKGNYAAVKLMPLLYAPPGRTTLIDLGDGTRIDYEVVEMGSSYVGQLHVYDKGERVYSCNAGYGSMNYQEIYIYPKCIVDNDYKQTGYYIKYLGFPKDQKGYNHVEVSDITRVYYNLGQYTDTTLIPFSSKNNYAVEYADGHYERLNKTDNVRIGGENDITKAYAKDGFYDDKFYKEGSLDVNGSLKARDTQVRSLKVNGSFEVVDHGVTCYGTIDNWAHPLIVGETTIQGTLHVEDNDIKSKSIYPAKTGSGTLKDKSKGQVKGNYKVSASNLGKGAHNYDKLFVKNIMWSDQTDIDNPQTSLNGEGTIRVWSKEGMDNKPTFYLANYIGYNDDNSDVGMGITSKDYHTINFFDKGSSNNEGYDNYIDVTLSDEGLKDNIHTTPFVWGNGKRYDEGNKIPQELWVPQDKYKDKFLELDSIALTTQRMNLNSPDDYFVYLSNGLNYDDEGSRFDGIDIGLNNDKYRPKKFLIRYGIFGSDLYIKSENTNSATKCFATNGTYFDMDTKADLVDGAVQMEQMPKDVRKTVKKAKKREVRYIPFKAINMNSINDGRYENRYVYNRPVMQHFRIPLCIDGKVKKAKITIDGKIIDEDYISFDRQNGRDNTFRTIVEKVDSTTVAFLRVAEGRRVCCNIDVSFLDEDKTFAFVPESYSVDEEGMATIEIKTTEIDDGITLNRKDYKMMDGKIKYTGRVAPIPVWGSIINVFPNVGIKDLPRQRNVYRIVIPIKEKCRKGLNKRKNNASDKNIYVNKKGEIIRKRKIRYTHSYSRLFSKGHEYVFTLATTKRDKFGHLSIYGYDKYKVSANLDKKNKRFYIMQTKRI